MMFTLGLRLIQCGCLCVRWVLYEVSTSVCILVRPAIDTTNHFALPQRLKKVSTQTYPGQPTRSKLAEWVGIVGSSGGAKMVASLITYPHEVIRTRLRQAPNPGELPKYTGLLQTLKVVIAEEG